MSVAAFGTSGGYLQPRDSGFLSLAVPRRVLLGSRITKQKIEDQLMGLE